MRGIHRWPVNSPHKGPVTRKMFPFDDVNMSSHLLVQHQSPCCHHSQPEIICDACAPTCKSWLPCTQKSHYNYYCCQKTASRCWAPLSAFKHMGFGQASLHCQRTEQITISGHVEVMIWKKGISERENWFSNLHLREPVNIASTMTLA